MQPVTFTTPDTALNAAQVANVPPEALSAIVTDELVTTLPAASSTFTTGSVVNAAPEAPATGWVVKTRRVATPMATLKPLLIAVAKAPSLAVTVYPLPARVTAHPENVTTPELSVCVQPESVAPLEPVAGVTASATVDESVVTTLPLASSTLTTGCTESAKPPFEPPGWVAKTSWVANPVDTLNAVLVATVNNLSDAVNV